MDKRTEKLLAFLDASPSVYHAADNLANELKNAGYTRLSEAEKWELTPGGKYYLTRGGSAVLAFRIPEGAPAGFMMSASHSDRPTFKVKENGELCGAYTRLAVERYGGMLIAPWLDRPLSIAGRVVVETEQGVQSKLLNIDRDLLMIPNVAIHMNRNANDGYKWNPAVDMLPLLGSKEAKGGIEPLVGVYCVLNFCFMLCLIQRVIVKHLTYFGHVPKYKHHNHNDNCNCQIIHKLFIFVIMQNQFTEQSNSEVLYRNNNA